jgi:crotonobetaine/carnitine-CoA ligase
VPDELREEEVLACVVLKPGVLPPTSCDDPLIASLLAHCNAQMAYYKAPGWLWFTSEIPVTGTQKVQKHQIFERDTDPRQVSGMMDLRPRKTRTSARPSTS